MFRLQENNDILKRLMLLKSMILHSRLFHMGTTLSQKKCVRTFNLE